MLQPAPWYRELATLIEALPTLSMECRRVLTLRKVYGWTQEQIAARLGLERCEVEDALCRCVLFCAEHLDEMVPEHPVESH